MKRPRIALSLLLAVVALLLSAMDAPSSRAGVADARGFLRSGPVCTSRLLANDPVIAPYLIGDQLGCYLCGLPSEPASRHAVAASSDATLAVSTANESTAKFEDLTPSDAVVAVPAATPESCLGPTLPQFAASNASIVAETQPEPSAAAGVTISAMCAGYIAALWPCTDACDEATQLIETAEEDDIADGSANVIVSDFTWLLSDRRIDRGGIDALLINWRQDGLHGLGGPAIAVTEPVAAEHAEPVASLVDSPTSEAETPAGPTTIVSQRQLVARIAMAVREDRERQAAAHAQQQAAMARAIRPWVHAAAALLHGFSTALDDVSVALAELEAESGKPAESKPDDGQSRTASREAAGGAVEPNVYHGL